MPAKAKTNEAAVKKTKAGKVEKPKASKAEKTKADKKEKDPNAPKRSSGAYMWFCKEHREVVKKENPDMKVMDIGKRLGQLWQAMSDKEKKKFQDLAEKDKQRYLRELAAYQKDDAGGSGDASEEEED